MLKRRNLKQRGGQKCSLSCINNTATFKTRMNNYYTYAYLREDKTPYYIGRGKHHKGYKYHRMSAKHTCGVPPQERRLILKDNLSKEHAMMHEEYMISLFGIIHDNTGILRNYVRDSCGGSSLGRKLSDETKRRMSLAMKKRWENGFYDNDEYRNKISESNRRNPRVKEHSEETKEKQRKASTGRLQSEEQKKKISESLKKWWADKKSSNNVN